jgi:hypothetical protein
MTLARLPGATKSRNLFAIPIASDAAAQTLAAGCETKLNSTLDVERELRHDHRGDDTES